MLRLVMEDFRIFLQTEVRCLSLHRFHEINLQARYLSYYFSLVKFSKRHQSLGFEYTILTVSGRILIDRLLSTIGFPSSGWESAVSQYNLLMAFSFVKLWIWISSVWGGFTSQIAYLRASAVTAILYESVSAMNSVLTGYLIESSCEMCSVLTPLCFGQTTIFGSWRVLSGMSGYWITKRFKQETGASMLNGAEVTSPVTFKNKAITCKL